MNKGIVAIEAKLESFKDLPTDSPGYREIILLKVGEIV